MLLIHATGDWGAGQLNVSWGPSGRRIVPEIERLIDEAWAGLAGNPRVRLFDGPMCRLESWSAAPAALQIVLSVTSYKPFLGTNLKHPELAARFGPEVMANPVGVSPALLTADGFLMMGRRNDSVAYYPGRTHPFAGALEPGDGGDVLGAVRRELAEEAGFTSDDVADVRCTGLVEDGRIRHPELIFSARSTRTREQIERMVDDAEHHATWSIPATPGAVETALPDPQLTPVARASLLLWGRGTFGDDWFAAVRQDAEGNL